MKYIKEAFRTLRKDGLCFIAYARNDSGYAITGDYLIPMVNREEVNKWLDVGFFVVSSTQRADGFYGVWMMKTNRNETTLNEGI
jgi:hypothetical protein